IIGCDLLKLASGLHYVCEIVALHADEVSHSQSMVVLGVGGESAVDERTGFVEVLSFAGFARLLQERLGKLALIIRVAGLLGEEALVHFNALVGGEAGPGNRDAE